jgi:hypothetical protein
MILKINVNDGWIFVNDIYNAEVRRNCQPKEEHGQPVFLTDLGATFAADYVIRDAYKNGDQSGPAPADFKVVSCFRNNNEPICYAFNTIGYLMNDEGKTIETI